MAPGWDGCWGRGLCKWRCWAGGAVLRQCGTRRSQESLDGPDVVWRGVAWIGFFGFLVSVMLCPCSDELREVLCRPGAGCWVLAAGYIVQNSMESMRQVSVSPGAGGDGVKAIAYAVASVL